MRVHKIREIMNHENSVEVVGKSNTHYLVINNESNTVLALPLNEWEEVPADKWQDVTGKCEFDRDGYITHKQQWVAGPDGRTNGYRLRKVNVKILHDADSRDCECAYIIERKSG